MLYISGQRVITHKVEIPYNGFSSYKRSIRFPILKQIEHIIFAISKGFTSVGLPRVAIKTTTPYKIVINSEIVEEKPLGWEDIIKMQAKEIYRAIIYVTAFTKCDREKNHEVIWIEFERKSLLL